MSELAGITITAVLSMLIFVDIVGNALVCAIIKRNRNMRTPMNYLLVNLAIADILYAAFIAPKIIFSVNLSHPDGVTGTVICKLLTGGAVAWIGAFSSIATLTAIAIERYYAVIFPFRNNWKLANCELKVIIPGVWILSLVLNIPMFLAMKVKDNFCIDSWPKQWMPKAYTLAIDSVVFIPLALMVLMYSQVVYTLWFKSDHDNKLTHQQRGVMRVRKRVTLMVITVSVIFGICWGTMQILYLLSYFASYNIGPVTIAIVNTMVLFNSAVNPFVYALLNQQFREKMKRMICCTGSLIPTVHPRQVLKKDIEPVINEIHPSQTAAVLSQE